MVVADRDGRNWAVQHQLPEDEYFDLFAGVVAAEIARSELVNAD